MRLVLDTSVLISALRSPGGGSALLLKLVLRGRVTLLLNLALAYEYREVAFRPEQLSQFSLSVEGVRTVIEQLESLSEAVDVCRQYRPLAIDPNDDLVLELAINGRADTIVTNNIRHLRDAARSFGIDVVDARTLLRTVKGA